MVATRKGGKGKHETTANLGFETKLWAAVMRSRTYEPLDDRDTAVRGG